MTFGLLNRKYLTLSIRDYRFLIVFPPPSPYSARRTHQAFQRARSPEAKAARRRAILAAASHLLADKGLEATTLNAIAQQAGVAKSNIYRYFESREEILMRLLADDLRAVSEELSAALPQPLPPAEVANILAQGMAENPRLCLLISITASTLEHNISTDTLRDIKRDMITALTQTSRALSQSLPSLPAQNARNAVQILFTLVAGLWPLSAPGPALKALYDEPEFSPLRQDFQPALAFAVKALLIGLSGPED